MNRRAGSGGGGGGPSLARVARRATTAAPSAQAPQVIPAANTVSSGTDTGPPRRAASRPAPAEPPMTLARQSLGLGAGAMVGSAVRGYVLRRRGLRAVRPDALLTDNSNNRRRRSAGGAVLVARGVRPPWPPAALAIPSESTPTSSPAKSKAFRRGPRPSGRRRSPATPPPQQPQDSQQAQRRLVDVVDREAAPPRRDASPPSASGPASSRWSASRTGRWRLPRTSPRPAGTSPGANPGQRGPAVIAGHIDSTSGPAVFYRLRELKRGNLIRSNATEASFVSGSRGSSAGRRRVPDAPRVRTTAPRRPAARNLLR